MFVIVAVLMSITVGAFLSMCIISNTNLKGWKKAIIGIAISVAIGCAISEMFVLEAKSNQTAWNNGYCYSCDTQWELVNVQKTRGGMHYFYTCPNCGEIIDLTQNPS
jgi:predicted RNA-binding Zn-ribbon protein involved in translation (DUF1610 family)